ELRRAKNNGEQLVCTMAFETKSKKGSTVTEYYICKVFTKTGLYKRVTKLGDNVSQYPKTGINKDQHISATGT
ncbi:MAG: hypothetical protein O7C70_09095, partial [Candidatus Dadabacteria bacterium]|nr:hypothetical protein [Candidatus Dadabacteria bacterium]